MRLTVNNFFSHLIFHPFSADNKKAKCKAFTASLACFILTLGLCHTILGIRRLFKHKTKEKTGTQDKKIANVANTVISKKKPNQTIRPPTPLKPAAPSNAPVIGNGGRKPAGTKLDIPQGTILTNHIVKPTPPGKRPPTNVRALPTLQRKNAFTGLPTQNTASPARPAAPVNQSKPPKWLNETEKQNSPFLTLLEGSRYTINHVSKYEKISNREMPKRVKMTTPLMSGHYDDERPFFIIQIACQLDKEQIDALDAFWQTKVLTSGNELRQTLFISALKGQFTWMQLREGAFLPLFFGELNPPDNETSSVGNTTNEHYIQKVKKLLNNETVLDSQGFRWKILNSDAS